MQAGCPWLDCVWALLATSLAQLVPALLGRDAVAQGQRHALRLCADPDVPTDAAVRLFFHRHIHQGILACVGGEGGEGFA